MSSLTAISIPDPLCWTFLTTPNPPCPSRQITSKSAAVSVPVSRNVVWMMRAGLGGDGEGGFGGGGGHDIEQTCGRWLNNTAATPASAAACNGWQVKVAREAGGLAGQELTCRPASKVPALGLGSRGGMGDPACSRSAIPNAAGLGRGIAATLHSEYRLVVLVLAWRLDRGVRAGAIADRGGTMPRPATETGVLPAKSGPDPARWSGSGMRPTPMTGADERITGRGKSALSGVIPRSELARGGRALLQVLASERGRARGRRFTGALAVRLSTVTGRSPAKEGGGGGSSPAMSGSVKLIGGGARSWSGKESDRPSSDSTLTLGRPALGDALGAIGGGNDIHKTEKSKLVNYSENRPDPVGHRPLR